MDIKLRSAHVTRCSESSANRPLLSSRNPRPSSHSGAIEATWAFKFAMHLTLTAPDDWHLHLRDGARMKSVVAHTAAQFRRALIMPNLAPPVETVEQAHAYRERILAAAGNSGFEPLMTLY